MFLIKLTIIYYVVYGVYINITAFNLPANLKKEKKKLPLSKIEWLPKAVKFENQRKGKFNVGKIVAILKNGIFSSCLNKQKISEKPRNSPGKIHLNFSSTMHLILNCTIS